ncbi:protein D3 [Rhipicephalus microplus]|uniref:protein D3 n=1 Tax=Rhipicephalus microplus TaxID=6941 RepID=UPI003F6C0C15
MRSPPSTTSTMRLAVTVVTILLAFVAHSACGVEELDKRQLALIAKAERSKLAPDLIETIPRGIFEAQFKSGEIAMGNHFTPEQASSAPSGIDFPRIAGNTYAIAMLDPDAPSKSDPKFRPILHWLVVNLDAGDTKKPVDYKKGTELFQYRGPKPPMGSGPHRYAFLAYKQYRPIEMPRTLVVPYDKRKNFNITKFAIEHRLGNPIAINYFLAEDAYVDGVTPLVSWLTAICLALTGLLCRVMGM